MRFPVDPANIITGVTKSKAFKSAFIDIPTAPYGSTGNSIRKAKTEC